MEKKVRQIVARFDTCSLRQVRDAKIAPCNGWLAPALRAPRHLIKSHVLNYCNLNLQRTWKVTPIEFDQYE